MKFRKNSSYTVVVTDLETVKQYCWHLDFVNGNKSMKIIDDDISVGDIFLNKYFVHSIDIKINKPPLIEKSDYDYSLAKNSLDIDSYDTAFCDYIEEYDDKMILEHDLKSNKVFPYNECIHCGGEIIEHRCSLCQYESDWL